MDYGYLCGIAVGLAMDACAASITSGACMRRVRFPFALKISFLFGFFQALMPMAGWLIGKAGEDIIRSLDHWIALILLGYLGGSMIWESHKKKMDGEACPVQDDIPLKRLLAMAVATSIDALATGIVLPTAVGAGTPARMAVSVLIIGMITFFICLIGVYAGHRFGTFCAGYAETAGGVVLITIGVKIFIEHMFLE